MFEVNDTDTDTDFDFFRRHGHEELMSKLLVKQSGMGLFIVYQRFINFVNCDRVCCEERPSRSGQSAQLERCD